MWQTLILIIVSIALALLAPKPKIENAKKQNLDPTLLPRASESDPIPHIFGRVRLRGPNCIYYGFFHAEPVKKKVPSIKFWKKKKVIVSYKYYITMDLALCSGPNVRLHKVISDKKVLYNQTKTGSNYSLTLKRGEDFNANCQFYDGSFNQSANAYINSKLATLPANATTGLKPRVPSYNGISHIVMKDAFIGEFPQMADLSFELSRYSNPLGLSNSVNVSSDGYDMNIVSIMYEIMTDSWNGINNSATDIDIPSFKAAAIKTAAENNFGSLIVSAPSTGSEVIKELLRQIDAVMYQDPTTGKIVLKLIRNDYDLDNAQIMDESNITFIQSFSSSSLINKYNQIRVKYTKRDKNYEEGFASLQNPSNINTQRRLVTLDIGFPACYNKRLANVLCAREMSQLSHSLYSVVMETNRQGSSLLPGDVFIMNWDDYGISNLVMRVKSVNLGRLQDNRVTIEAVQDRFASDAIVFDNFDEESTVDEAINLTPQDSTSNRVWELPRNFIKQDDDLSVLTFPASSFGAAFFAVPANSYHTSLRTTTSTSNFTTSQLSSDFFSFPPTAKLKGNLPIGFANKDKVIAALPIIDLALGDYTLDLYSLQDIRDSGGFFLIGNELFAYEDASIDGNGNAILLRVHRAMSDTVSEAHSANDRIWFFDDTTAFSNSYIPSAATRKFRFISRTPSSAQSPADAPVVAFNGTRRREKPLPPDYITVNGFRAISSGGVNSSASMTVAWRRRNNDNPQFYLFNDPDDPQEAGTTYTVSWVFKNTVGASVSTGSTAGLTGTTKIIPALGTPINGTLEITITATNSLGLTSAGEKLTLPVSKTTGAVGVS